MAVDVRLLDRFGEYQTYTDVETITVPLSDGSSTALFTLNGEGPTTNYKVISSIAEQFSSYTRSCAWIDRVSGKTYTIVSFALKELGTWYLTDREAFRLNMKFYSNPEKIGNYIILHSRDYVSLSKDGITITCTQDIDSCHVETRAITALNSSTSMYQSWFEEVAPNLYFVKGSGQNGGVSQSAASCGLYNSSTNTFTYYGYSFWTNSKIVVNDHIIVYTYTSVFTTSSLGSLYYSCVLNTNTSVCRFLQMYYCPGFTKLNDDWGIITNKNNYTSGNSQYHYTYRPGLINLQTGEITILNSYPGNNATFEQIGKIGETEFTIVPINTTDYYILLSPRFIISSQSTYYPYYQATGYYDCNTGIWCMYVQNGAVQYFTKIKDTTDNTYYYTAGLCSPQSTVVYDNILYTTLNELGTWSSTVYYPYGLYKLTFNAEPTTKPTLTRTTIYSNDSYHSRYWLTSCGSDGFMINGQSQSYGYGMFFYKYSTSAITTILNGSAYYNMDSVYQGGYAYYYCRSNNYTGVKKFNCATLTGEDLSGATNFNYLNAKYNFSNAIVVGSTVIGGTNSIIMINKTTSAVSVINPWPSSDYGYGHLCHTYQLDDNHLAFTPYYSRDIYLLDGVNCEITRYAQSDGYDSGWGTNSDTIYYYWTINASNTKKIFNAGPGVTFLYDSEGNNGKGSISKIADVYFYSVNGDKTIPYYQCNTNEFFFGQQYTGTGLNTTLFAPHGYIYHYKLGDTNSVRYGTGTDSLYQPYAKKLITQGTQNAGILFTSSGKVGVFLYSLTEPGASANVNGTILENRWHLMEMESTSNGTYFYPSVSERGLCEYYLDNSDPTTMVRSKQI